MKTVSKRWIARAKKMKDKVLGRTAWEVHFRERLEDGTERDHGWAMVWSKANALETAERWENEGPASRRKP